VKLPRREAGRFQARAVRPAGLRTWSLWRDHVPGSSRGRSYVVEVNRVQNESGRPIKLVRGMQLDVTLEDGSEKKIALAVQVAATAAARA
jgi:hypothetical protein